MTTTHSSTGGRTSTEIMREQQVRRRVLLLAVLATGAVAAFQLLFVQGSWSYAMDLRLRQVGALVVVGAAVGASSVVFQTIAGSRILTPGVMGFDSVYVLVQTVVVYVLGASTLQLMGVTERFLLNTLALSAFGLLLFRWLFRRYSTNLFVLVLVGVVLGSLFASLTTLASRMLSPDDYLTLQTVLFASFTTVDATLLGVTSVACAAGLLLLRPLTRFLDVVDLGRDHAVALGVPYHRVVTQTLLVVTLLVATSTALVGPVTFLGLIVANLARHVLPTHRHDVLIVGAALVGVTCTVSGQFLVVHAFGLHTTLSVVVNLVGGLYFIWLLLRTRL
ncbi:MAG: iron chelate uptake ABC transporter family permease subunit [Ornithinimicrobium sp.]